MVLPAATNSIDLNENMCILTIIPLHNTDMLNSALAECVLRLLRKLAATLQETTLPANETGGL